MRTGSTRADDTRASTLTDSQPLTHECAHKKHKCNYENNDSNITKTHIRKSKNTYCEYVFTQHTYT